MTPWLLIITFFVHGGVAIESIEFKGRESCEAAKEAYERQLREDIALLIPEIRTHFYVCVKK